MKPKRLLRRFRLGSSKSTQIGCFLINQKTMNETLKADFQAVADKNGVNFTITQQVTTEETTTFTHNQ